MPLRSNIVFALPLPLLLLVAGCTEVDESLFYDRQNIQIDGQQYSVATRPGAGKTVPDDYFVRAHGRWWSCEAPTAEGCADAVRRANDWADRKKHGLIDRHGGGED